jgi:predicted metal-dependent hydrolase
MSETVTPPLWFCAGDRRVPVRFRRFRQSRAIKLSIDRATGALLLSGPPRLSEARALAFLDSNRQWVAAQLAQIPPCEPVGGGSRLLVHGETRQVRWRPDSPRQPQLLPDAIILGGPPERIGKRVGNWLRAQALPLLAADLAHYCARAGQPLPELRLGDARRRWGSCCARGVIRLNWRLVMMPPAVRRAIVAHEVAHLEQMNHSPAFYAALDRIFDGDRRACDAWLRRHGPDLHRLQFG